MTDLTPESMNAFWNDKWAQGQTAWRNWETVKSFAENFEKLSARLTQYNADTNAASTTKTSAATQARRRVGFVPLCGDTYGMRALTELGIVDCCVGLDLSLEAIQKAVDEHFVNARSESGEALFVAKTEKLAECTVFRVTRVGSEALVAGFIAGDFFAASVQDVVRALAVEGRGGVAVSTEGDRHIDFVYDRASMVALPPALREPYVAFLITLLGGNHVSDIQNPTVPSGVVYLDLVRRPADEHQFVRGPPFHIRTEDVVTMYNATKGSESGVEWKVELSQEGDLNAGQPFQFNGYVVFCVSA